MHSVAHQFSVRQVRTVARALDTNGVPVVEVSHGDGLGGSSIQYGRSRASDEDRIKAAIAVTRRSNVAVLLLPGIGTLGNLQQAWELGASIARIATHCTEADIAEQHISWASEHMDRTVGFLMMSHMVSPNVLAEQAKLMQGYGADVVYVVDSAGALVPEDVKRRVSLLREALECEVGFHAHNNLGCAVGNSLAAADEGATWLDGSMCGLGAGAGNAQTEVLCAALERSGFDIGVDLFGLIDAAETLVKPFLRRPQIIDRSSLVLGYGGVYSSFLLPAGVAASRYGVDVVDVLVEAGRRKLVGGQEDMLIDIAVQLASSPSEISSAPESPRASEMDDKGDDPMRTGRSHTPSHL